jgi:hypothetical protein
MVDSGAFSAWTLNKSIDINKYCDYLHENAEWIECYIALDVIIPEDTEQAAAKGFENFVYMRSRDLDPIPVFHQGEPIEYLYKYLEAGCEYIALSATSLAQKQYIDYWYELVWPHLINKDGLPIIRIHTLGDCRERPLRMFPWYSCDSASWAYMAQVYARVQLAGGERDRSHGKQRGHALTQRNDFHSDRASRDIGLLDPTERDQLDAYLSQYGINSEVFFQRAENSTGAKTAKRYQGADNAISLKSLMARTYLTLRFYQDLEARIRTMVPIHFHPRGGFVNHVELPDVSPDPHYDDFHMYFAITANPSALASMYAVRHEYLLASYFYLNKARTDEVKRFCDDAAKMVYTGRSERYTLAINELLGRTEDEGRRTVPPAELVRAANAETRPNIKLSRPGAGS